MTRNKKYFRKAVSTHLYVFVCLTLISSCSKEPDELKSPKLVENFIELIAIKNNVPSDNISFAEIGAIIKVRPTANELIVFGVTNLIY